MPPLLLFFPTFGHTWALGKQFGAGELAWHQAVLAQVGGSGAAGLKPQLIPFVTCLTLVELFTCLCLSFSHL